MFSPRICTVAIALTISACSASSSTSDTTNQSTAALGLNTSDSSLESSTATQVSNTVDSSNLVTNTTIDVDDTNTLDDSFVTDSTVQENDPSSTINQATNTSIDIGDTNGMDDSSVAPVALPSGCIGDVDTANRMYCVYPNERLFIASLADGSTWWSFTLPGENDNNEIEAVVVVGNELVLIADTSPLSEANVDEKYELSRFETSGQFIQTSRITLTPKSGSDTCEDLWCAYYDTEGFRAFPNQADELMLAQQTTTYNGKQGLVLGWSRYHGKELNASANSAVKVFEGAVVSIVELESGQTIAEHLYPEERIERIIPLTNGDVNVITDNRESQLNSRLMSTVQLDSAVTGLNGKPITQWLPDWHAAISAEPLRELATQIGYFEDMQGWLRGSTVAEDIDADTLFGDNAIQLSDIDVAGDSTETGYSEGIIEYSCANGGMVTITFQTLSPPTQIGDGLSNMSNQHYQFNQCAFTVDDQSTDGSTQESLDSGPYLLHGVFLKLNDFSNSQAGSNSQSEWQAETLQVTYSTDTIVEITGWNRNSDSRDARAFSRFLSHENEISHYSKVINGIETKRWLGFSSNVDLLADNHVINWGAEVQGDVFDADIADTMTNIQTLQPLSRVNYQTISNKPFDEFSGEIVISAGDGQRILLQPISDQTSAFTREWILVSGDRDGIPTSSTIPLQSFVAPVSIEEHQ